MSVALASLAQSTENRKLSSFSKISANEGIEVFIKQGEKDEARVVANEVDIKDVLTEIKRGVLKIHMDNDGWDENRNIDVEVYVTYVSIDALSASSAGSIEGESEIETDGDFVLDVSSAGEIKAKIKANKLTISASSAGDMDLEIDVSEIEASISSAGDISLAGKAVAQDVDVSSSGDYDAYDLNSDRADLNASSGGSIKVSVSNKMDAEASSGGSIRYKGTPPYIKITSSSGGSINKS